MYNIEKKNAAKEALNFVKENSVIALGSGSTMVHFIRLLAKSKLKVKCIPSSKQIQAVAKKHKLRLINASKNIDLAIDGADQIDKNLNLLKGQGALAFVEEKKLDYKAKKCIIIADKTKKAKKLNKEVLVKIKNKKALTKIRQLAKITKKKNNILFLKFKQIKNPRKLEKDLNKIYGLIDNGIFANFRKKPLIIIGKKRGVELLR
jgi:ribose 5-phosphate isomerase A